MIEEHVTAIMKPSSTGKQHDEFKGMYKLRMKMPSEIHKTSLIHRSVKDRNEKMENNYRGPALRKFLKLHNKDCSTVNIVSQLEDAERSHTSNSSSIEDEQLVIRLTKVLLEYLHNKKLVLTMIRIKHVGG